MHRTCFQPSYSFSSFSLPTAVLSLHSCNLSVCWRSWTWLSWSSVAEWAWWSVPPRWRRPSRSRSTRSRRRSSPSGTDSTPAFSWPLSGPENKLILQCCGAGSGIRYFFDPWIPDPVLFGPLDPRSGTFLSPGSRIRDDLNNQDPGWTTQIIFPRAQKTVFWVKYFNSLTWIRDPGWEKIGSGIRDGKKSDPG